MITELRNAGGRCKIERRDDGGLSIEGHAAVFDAVADIAGFFDEKIARGAFQDVLSDDVRLLINHDGMPLARTKSETLELKEDKAGLHIRADLNGDDPEVRALIPKLERGDLDQMSFGFSMEGGVEEWDDSGEKSLRTIKRVGELFDVSIVTFPAYDETQVGIMRSLAKSRKLNASRDRARRLRLSEKTLALRAMRLNEK